MPESHDAFVTQSDVRRPWRRYLDLLAPLRPELHRYCTRLAGNVWDGEDLAQDALVRVFSMLGKIDADLENPRAYLIRTATNIWIDRMRRHAREAAALVLEAVEPGIEEPQAPADAKPAVDAMFRKLHPQERAAIVMKDVLDLSLEESAALLKTSTGAVKAALNRARGRLAEIKPAAGFDAPPRELVERFMIAMRNKDLEALRAMCAVGLTVELVGGAESEGFDRSRMFFEHAHMVFPGFGQNPRWEMTDYGGEPVVIGFRTLDGVEGLNEVHRLSIENGKIARVRCYCFCPDTLRTVAEDLGIPSLARPYRSPSPEDFAAPPLHGPG
jgi:RNA polymerase sigma-70 factor (ECF subfamily)